MSISSSTDTNDEDEYVIQPDNYVCTDEHCPAPCRHHDHGHTHSTATDRMSMLYEHEATRNAAEYGCQHCQLLTAIREHILRHSAASSSGSNITILRKALGIADSSIDVQGTQLQLTVQVFRDKRPGYFLRLDVNRYDTKVCSVEYAVGMDSSGIASAFQVPTFASPHEFMDVASNYSMSKVESWFSTCRSQHDRCRQGLNDIRPHRLLRLTNDLVQLVEDVDVEYAALSYTWSGANLPVTLESNFKHRLSHPVPWKDIPLTLQNAITVARRLKLDYVWIDCMCIIQGSKADWEREVVIMGEIYKQAELVISTDAADTPNTGFLSRAAFVDPIAIDINGSRYILRDASTHRETGKVASRAWCYQERILARRTIKFAGRELMWECSAGCSCECGQDNETQHDAMLQFDRPGYQISNLVLSAGGPVTHSSATDKGRVHRRTITAYEYWLFAVERYSLRSITYTSDRLPAIRSLAAFVQERTGDVYIAGVWRKDILRSLLWHVYGKPWDEQPREISYAAPSWSWASILKPVRFFAHTELETPFVACVVDVSCRLASDDPLGSILSARLTIEAPCLDVLVCKRGEDFNCSHVVDDAEVTIKPLPWHAAADRSLWRWNVFDAAAVDAVEVEVPSGRRMTLRRADATPDKCQGWTKMVWITASRALILGVSPHHAGGSERLGLARLPLLKDYPVMCETVTLF